MSNCLTLSLLMFIAAVAPEPYDPHPQYNYGYSVSDGLTGDQKTAQESRDGDVVQGSYSLVEPDGAVRTVRYTADSIHGFNAVVERSAPQVTKAVVAAAPVARYAVAAPAVQYAAAPAVRYAAAPVATYAHAAPVATYAHAAPVAHYAAAPAVRYAAAPAVAYGGYAAAPAYYHH